MLSLNNITYILHDKLIFNNISDTFNDGEIIGITGAEGSGKSSFVNLIRSKDRMYGGSILIDDQDITTDLRKQLKILISHYSSVKNIFNPESTVREWILGGRINHKKLLGPYTETDKNIAEKEMTIFGLDDSSDIRLKMISETSRKMASLAKAFSACSKILLLEKPEAGLNINQKVLLTKGIKKYTSDGNRIVILTSTDLNFLAATCDRIIVLADNIIAESGTQKMINGEFVKKYFNVEAVVTKNIYSGLPEIQIIEEN